MAVFSVSGAIAQIATYEAAIVSPTPGIQNSYGYGSNPVEIDDPADLPAVVHISRGPSTLDFNEPYEGMHRFTFDIDSVALLVEAVPDGYPSDENFAVAWWQALMEAFHGATIYSTMLDQSQAYDYQQVWEPGSFAIRRWPPEPMPEYKIYWSYRYTHRFWISG